MSKQFQGLQFAAFIIVLIASLVAAPPTVQAAPNLAIIDPADMDQWFFYNDGVAGVSSGTLVSGPATPPLGTGSARLQIDSTARMVLGTTEFTGTPVADLTSLSFAAYQPAFGLSLQFDVDYDGTDSDVTYQGRLVYESVYSGIALQPNAWQTWDALADTPSGSWWSSRAPGDAVCPQSNPCNLSEVLAAFPDAVVSGALMVKAGGPIAGGFTGYTDAITVGINGVEDTFDLEQAFNTFVDAAIPTYPGVNGLYHFGTMQGGVNAVVSGGTVSVAAGTYHENVTVSKPLTLTGAGAGTDPTQHVILDGNTPAALSGCGISLSANIAGITISGLRVQDYLSGSGICGSRNNNLNIHHVEADNNGVAGSASGGVFLGGPIDTVVIDHVTATNNRTRGIVIWDGYKSHITYTNNTVTGNTISGIELQDGTASGVTATGNVSENNSDSGMAFIGLTSGAGANLIANNTVRNNGRFGIEIKLPNGTGLTSGDGSIVVERNLVETTIPITTQKPTEERDMAGIAVYRRGWTATGNNVDIPTGVVVRENQVNGYQQVNALSTSDGFGIVVEGNNMQVLNNVLNGNDVGIQIQAGHLPYTANTNIDGDQSDLDDDYFGRGNSPVASGTIRYNQLTGNTTGVRSVGVAATTNATCNNWNEISGPTDANNPGGAGQPVSAGLSFAPWLVYGDADAVTTGFQLPTAFTVAPVGEVSAAVNDFRVLANAITCVTSGQTITLNGTFDWTQPLAQASWALGADGNAAAMDDNYWIVGPANTNDVTLTAASLGSATIQGPGDLADADMEGFFGIYYGTPGTNHNWTISNLQIFDVDVPLGFYYGGGSNQYYGLTLDNNHLRVARDLNGIAAPNDQYQNIGIHLAYGKDQTVSNNIIDLPGDGASDATSTEWYKYSSEVALQSNTHGGDAYDGLQIVNNTVNVLHAQNANPARLRGIWENGHAHSSDILVSGNTFNNLDAANDATLNQQVAFRVTSHSSAATTVTYQNNTANGANTAFFWLDTGATTHPVQFTGNTANIAVVGVQLGANGKAAIERFTYTGPDMAPGSTGVKIVTNSQASITSSSIRDAETGIDIAAGATSVQPITLTILGANTTAVNNHTTTELSAENNWWGCNEGPNETGCSPVVGLVDSDPRLVFGLTVDPSEIMTGGIAVLTATLNENSAGVDIDPADLIWTGLRVNFTATQGSFNPAIANLLNGLATSEWTHTSAERMGFSVSGTLDGETITLTVTVQPLTVWLPIIFR